MANGFFQGKTGVKRIVLLAVAIFLAAVMIAGNIILNWQAPLLHGVFQGGGTSEGKSPEAENALASADELVQEIAEESIVLLKNEDNFLPREKSEKFNLFGWGATDHGFLLVGGGSGGTNIDGANPMRVTLTQAFEKEGIEYNRDLTEAYNAFSTFDADYREGGSTGKDAIDSLKNPGESFYTNDLMNQAVAFSSTAVVVLSRWGCENGGTGELVNLRNSNYKDGTVLELTAEEKILFEKLAANNFNVIVLLNTTNPIELGFLDDYVNIKACLYVGIPGQSGATAIPKILTGSVDPSGRLSDTFAKSWQEHNPTYANTLSQDSSIVYQEGIYFGYKWYETADAAGYYEAQGTSYENVVAYPFGYGLSYTTFEQEIVRFGYRDGENFVSLKEGDELEADREYEVTVRVTNTGYYAGREVVQLYYEAPYTAGGIEKSSINLLAFDKTALLEPDDPQKGVQEVTLTFTVYDLASYDAYDKNNNGFAGYELDEGDYQIKLMANAHDVYPEKEGADNVFSLYCGGIRIENDPVTGEKVENRFTGASAYAGLPIDGNAGADGNNGIAGGVIYLSRENAFANFPKTAAGRIDSAARSASGFDYSGYDNADVSSFQYGQDGGKYLVTAEDGSKASLDALSGKDQSVKLKMNEALIDSLSDWDSPDWDAFLNQLSQNEIKDLIGKGGFQTMQIASIGKPRNQDSDGPAGFNSNVVNPDAHSEWTVFPAETLTGCSWSCRLTYNLGHAQGAVGVTTGRQGWYAPGVNLHRSVYNSRNYEYYSEDGILSGKLAAETVRGAKENNLYCYVKHFVMSEPGENAKDWYVWTTEQALRENYLRPFEICVKEGEANAMMSAFNKLGAVWCGYNHALLTDILRTEWGFKGSVITDWFTGYMNNYGKAVKAGNDLWLNSTNEAANVDFSNAAQAYGARTSAKGILYTYVDTYKAAKTYQEKVASGEYEDPYNVTLGVNVTAAAFSPVFVALWVVIDVVLALGIGACVLFMFLPKKKQSQEE